MKSFDVDHAHELLREGKDTELFAYCSGFPDDALATYSLGCFYRAGRGVEKDNGAAFRSYQRSLALAKDGDDIEAACRCLVECYLKGIGTEIDLDMADHYYIEFGAVAPDGRARSRWRRMESLVENYLEGRDGFPRDPFRALEIAKRVKAAAGNDRERCLADWRLGCCYDSTEYHEKMAREGDAEHQRLLGMRYLEGYQGHYYEIIEKDEAKALYWLSKSAEQDNADAQFALGRLYYGRKESEQDKYIAVSWLLRAAAHSGKAARQATFLLAEIYDKDPVLRNGSQAMYWYEKAAEGGNIYAQYWMGLAYYEGTCVNQDMECAAKWFHEAASDHWVHPLAAVYVGFFYEKGTVFEKSTAKATSWYGKAYENAEEEEIDALIDNLRKIDMIKTLLPLQQENAALKEQIAVLEKENRKASDRQLMRDHNFDMIHEELKQLRLDMSAGFARLYSLLQDEISAAKKLVDSSVRSCGTEQDREAQYMNFVNGVANAVCGRIFQENSKDVDVEEAALKGLFGACWSGLHSYTRRSLISARVFLNNCSRASYEGLDFSGVVIACTSALENELKLRFFVGYQDYLRGRYGTNFQRWPKAMKFYVKVKQAYKPAEIFTLGTMPLIFGGRSRIRNKYSGEIRREVKEALSPADKAELEGYLKTILIREDDGLQVFFEENAEGLSFLDRCEDIRFVYRNAAAHTEVMSRESAEACCQDIMGVTQKDAAQEIGRIQGLLYDLIKLTRIP